MKNDWSARADETFLVNTPARPRVLLEVAFVVALVFAASAFVVSNVTAAIVVGCELVLAMALVRPWARIHGTLVGRVFATALVVLAVVAPVAIERPNLGESRHLGVGVATGALEAGDPSVAGGVVRIENVAPRSPADGVLRAGDRIVAIGGAPLDRDDPTSDLSRRTHGDELAEDTTVTVIREHSARDLAVHIPRPRGSAAHLDRRIAAVRDMASRHLVVAAAIRGALVIGLLLLLLRADGQPIASIGLTRKGSMRELFAATWMTPGTFLVQVIVAIPIGLIGVLLGVIEREQAQRTEALDMIARQGTILEFALAAIVAAAFEEIAFRGFLLPRVRSVVGSWWLAAVLVSILFGAGHFYEGALATIQTAFLGLWFAALMLARRRIVGPIAAHAAFNTIMIIFVRIVSTTHLLERLRAIAPR